MRTEWGRLEQRLFGLLVHAYPREFRGEYGVEMRDCFMEMRGAAEGGVWARLRLWLRLVVDTVHAAPLERWRSFRSRRRSDVVRPDYAGAMLAAGLVFLLYGLTLAPTTSFWDAGEYITVARVLGIPHPPGNPLFVLIGRVWDMLLSPTGWPTAVRINLLSAVMSGCAHGLLFLVLERSVLGSGWTRAVRRVAAGCGIALSASAFTVWQQSNVNEKVYTISFFTVLLCVWLVLRWRDTRKPALLLAAAYVAFLTMANHLMGALVVPALVLFVLLVDWRAIKPRLVAVTAALFAIAVTAHLFLPLRAAQQPLVNEGDPRCASLADAAATVFTLGGTQCSLPGAQCSKLQRATSSVTKEAVGCVPLAQSLRRDQYQKPSIKRDPTDTTRVRGSALLAGQFVNFAQYLDWQWSRPLAGRDALFGWPRPLVTSCILLLVLVGARTHWRADRKSAVLYGVLLLTMSAGLVLYLNFKWGYTIANDAFPDRSMHEVRERDYFFLISFSLFGAWAGVGLASLWHRLATGLRTHARNPQLLAAPLLGLALVPLVLNWGWTNRADDWTARDWAYNVLMSVEPYGVLVTNGDNDSFPLWYLQHVERIREDVTIVLSPYLGTAWYARQIRDLTRPCPQGMRPARDATVALCQRPFRAEGVHPRLLAAWGGSPARAPEDSILPLADGALDELASTYFMVQAPVTMRAGGLETTIEPGTIVTAEDTFVASILQHTYGKRPIHFMSPSPVATRLGLVNHTVRVGLTWRLKRPDESDRIVALPDEQARGSTGAFIDLLTTDTLSEHVFMIRGRVADADSVWVDHATFDIPLQYSLMHYAAARAHEVAGSGSAWRHHAERIEFWNRVAE